MSLLRPALRPALNPITKTLLSVARRFFTQFDDVAESRITLQSEVSVTPPFEVEVVFQAQPAANFQTLIGNDDFALRLDTDSGGGRLRTLLPRNNVPDTPRARPTSLAYSNTSLNKVVFRRLNSTDFELEINGLIDSFSFNDIDEIIMIQDVGGRSSADITDGIIADVKIIDNGATVLDMPIDQNYTPTNNTVIDRASGNNGTFVNVADGDSEAYTLEGGDWVTGNISAISITEVLGDSSDPELASTGVTTKNGSQYTISAVCSSSVGASDSGWTGSGSGLPTAPPFRDSALNVGQAVGGTFTATGVGTLSLFGRAGSNVSFERISVIEKLEVAY